MMINYNRKYLVIEDTSIRTLEREVSAKLAEGYILQGGISQGENIYSKRFYMQAMVHKSALEEDNKLK